MTVPTTSGKLVTIPYPCSTTKRYSVAWPSGTPPVRSQPNESQHRRYTSIQLRIKQWKKKTNAGDPEQSIEDSQPPNLMQMIGSSRQDMPQGFAFNLIEYIELIDWTGRIIRQDKRGAIADDLPPILQRLEFSSEQWVELTTRFEHRFKGLVGTIESLKAMCANIGLKRTVNLSTSNLLLQ